MESLVNFYDRLDQKQKSPHFVEEPEDSRQMARILFLLIWASWIVFLFVIFTALYYSDWQLVTVTLVGCVLLIVPFVLIKGGHLRSSGLILVLIMLGTVIFIATVGQGIRDLAIVTLPIILIFAGLSLDRALFRLCFGLMLIATGWLSIGEIYGWIVTKPFNGEGSNWFYLVGVTIILLVAALVVELLVTNIRMTLEQKGQEIVHRKQAEEILREKEVQYRNLADSGKALIWVSGKDKLCNYFNIPWLMFTGRTLEQEIGNGWAEGVHPDDFSRCLEIYITAFDKLEAFEMEYRLHHVSGEYRWIQDLGTPNYDSNNEFIGYIGHCFDITERKRMEEQLRFLGTHDILTGIYNRNFFEVELARYERGREYPISMVIADVDGLKIVNDTQGHAVGDELLVLAANVLRSGLRVGDVLARIGGDEFAALLPATDSETAEQIMFRIRERLVEHNTRCHDLPVQLSIG
ncbi:MAG: diguanylate cyclase, partial [Leptolinea sp.]